MARKPTIALVGAGSLAGSLGPALRQAGYSITQVVSRHSVSSLRHARALARRLGSQTVTLGTAVTAELLWFCVPDREIRRAAASISATVHTRLRFAFHSSGALSSSELEPLRRRGIAVASVHPLMTFVAGTRPRLENVPFAIEGDGAALRVARKLVRDLGGESFRIPTIRKAEYHAWATMTSPLLLAFLVTLEDAATMAGISRADARRKSMPIIQQTLENYAKRGPTHSFSGPISRGDTETVVQHLRVLRKDPIVEDAYLALARSALRRLPVNNRIQLEQMLKRSSL